MSRPVPMAPCLALLKAFDRDNVSPQQTIAAAAQAVDALIDDSVELTQGQFAALVDQYIWAGETAFKAGHWVAWVEAGNFAKPPRLMATLGLRGRAERDVWNVGAGG